MSVSRFLWLSVPLLGLFELGAQLFVSHRAPTVAEWRAARAPLTELRRGAEPVVIAPYWAEPIARHAFGDELMPLADVAPADFSAWPRAIEVSALGQHRPELSGWRVVQQRDAGKVHFRLLENPAPARVLYDFVDQLGPEHASVRLTTGCECAWTSTAGASAGGLHGPIAYPARRFQCAGGDVFFAGVTVVEDQRYRPHRCIFAHPPSAGALSIRYRSVKLGPVVRGYAGLTWFLTRDGGGAPVNLEVLVGGESLGTRTHKDEEGWAPFELPTGARAGSVADVEFRISSESTSGRDYCFQADTR